MDMWIFLHSKSCMLSYIIRAILLSVISLATWFFIIDFLFMWTVLKSIHIFNSVLCSPFHFSLLTFYTSFHLICFSTEIFIILFPLLFSPLFLFRSTPGHFIFFFLLYSMSLASILFVCVCVFEGEDSSPLGNSKRIQSSQKTTGTCMTTDTCHGVSAAWRTPLGVNRAVATRVLVFPACLSVALEWSWTQDTVSFFMRHSELEKNLQIMFKTAPKASFMKGYAFNFHVAKLIISHTSASFQWVNCIEKELRRNAENKWLWKSRFYKNPLISSIHHTLPEIFPWPWTDITFPFVTQIGFLFSYC